MNHTIQSVNIIERNNSMSSFFHDDEDDEAYKEVHQSPSFNQFSLHHLSFIPEPPSSPSPLLPPSPESIWSRSPLLTPTHPSLLYCCISSMHRDGDIYSIAVSNDLVLTGSSSHRIHAWQPLDCHAKGYIHASSGGVRAMVAHGEVLFTSHKDHKIRVWNMKNCSGNSSSSSFRPRKLTTLPNDSHFKKIISRPITPQIKGTSKPIIIPQHRDTISCMAYYHVEGILYTGSFDRTIKAWRVNEKKCFDSFIAHGGNINDMVVNQQNGYLFTCSSDGTVKMWLRVNGENSHALIRVLVFHAYPFHALAFSVAVSHKSFLYSGSTDGTINYWEQEISCRYTHGGFLQGHRFAVLSLVTIENIVISGSEDSTIRIWKREKGRGNIHECLAVLEGHRGPVRCLAAFLQKDKFALSFLVYSASLDQTFKAWRVKLSSEVKKSPFGDDDDDDDDDREESKSQMEFETSPVLSPSWVKKKLQISRSLHKLV